MDEEYTPILSEEERAARRARRARLRRQKQRARRHRQLLLLALAALVLVPVALLAVRGHGKTPSEPDPAPDSAVETKAPAALPPEEPQKPYSAAETAATVQLGDSIASSYAIVVDLQTDTVLAEKDAYASISPASMTKILTLLVAAEHITDLDDTFTMTIDITDYCYVNDCSVVGLLVGETVPVRELLYGTILPSGADAALGLAAYVAGSQEAFVELMNEKLEELGLSGSAHFTNCVGLYSEDHFCTVYDMAMILKAAMDNDLCREVLSAHTYETAPTPEHPDGQTLSNWFLRKIEDHDQDQAIRAVGAKTGYVAQSGSCAASWGEDAGGSCYICVTGDTYSSWRAIYDHVELYKSYCG